MLASVLFPDNLEVVFDAESDEYLSILSPSEGVNVMLHKNDLTNTSPAMLGRSKHSTLQNSHLHIDILQVCFYYPYMIFHVILLHSFRFSNE